MKRTFEFTTLRSLRFLPEVCRHMPVAMLAAFALIVAAGCTSHPTLVKAPHLYVVSTDDPFANVPEALQGTSIEVLYATDREPETVENVFGYSAERSRAVFFGLCTVQVGDDATSWDDLIAASITQTTAGSLPLTLTDIDEHGRYPALRAMIERDGHWVEDPLELEEQAEATREIHELLGERLALTPRKELFVFVHGYHNTFAQAAFRTAQIWHYTGRGGVPVMYSWPAGSPGLLQGYTRDRESGEFANPHIKRFLRDIASSPDVHKIHLIAHSRGTDVLGTALRELHNEIRAAGKQTRDELKLGQIVLAAPDIDIDVFVERFSSDRTGFIAEQITIYVSPDDKAIGLATWLFGSLTRIGRLTLNDLHPDVARMAKHHPVLSIVQMRGKTDRTGHGYFLTSPTALSDLILVLRDGRRPGKEHGRPLVDDPDGFWELHDGYPKQMRPQK